MKQLEGFLPLVLIVLVFWALVIRPASKRQREMRATQSSVEVGSQIVLNSGIYGTVRSVEDATLQIEVAPGTELKVARQAVVRVIDPGEPREDANHAPEDSRPTDATDDEQS